MRRAWRFLVAGLALLFGRRSAKRADEREEPEPIVQPARGDRAAELVVIGLLLAAAVCAVGFMVVYAFDDLRNQNQLLGIAIGLAFVSVALITAGKRLVANEEIEEEYPEPEDPEEQEAIDRIVRESGTPITRKKLLGGAGGAAGGAILLAAITPALSFGPWLETDPLSRTPWRRGRRLVDDRGRPLRADAVREETFYTAYPEGASRDDIGAAVVLVRLDPAALRLPPERSGWAPGGIVAYSKVCTHAGCAISLYRKPTFPPTQPRPALVCPCHYSTFDPSDGAAVIFGPAGRPLPQLPLLVDAAGELRAGGNLSGPPGPSWSGVRERGAES